jgi:protein-L-isoaspartate(D-aspartate) O-methyltransferase
MVGMMNRDDELRIVRRAFAKQIAHAARVSDPRFLEALAELRREDFLPPGPWQVMRFPGGYQQTPDDDPIYLYQDAPVAILPEKGLNNGQPSFLTFLLSLGRLRDGERAVHVGTGTGYYTAVISHLAGRAGRVTGIELEPDLAARARANLRRCANVRIVEGDGSTVPLEPADVIYVNAGASRPADLWLDALRDGGRMVLPLTVRYTTDDRREMTRGAIFLIERQAEGFSARCMSTTLIYPCAGARDDASEAALAAAFEKGNVAKVTRLYRADDIPEERCWLRAPGWSLAYE